MPRLFDGVQPQLEEIANKLIKDSLEGVTSRAEKSDILTPWKERNRRSVEVYSNSGVVDPAARQGNFHRERNSRKPYLNSTNGLLSSGAMKLSYSSYEKISGE